jgi:hypothetical protein
LELAVRAVADRVHEYDIDSLPADLAQLVLDELIYTAKLDSMALKLFSRQYVYNLKLADYVGVEDGWLAHLKRSPLQRVSLAHCSEVEPSVPFQDIHGHLFISGASPRERISNVWHSCVLRHKCAGHC